MTLLVIRSWSQSACPNWPPGWPFNQRINRVTSPGRSNSAFLHLLLCSRALTEPAEQARNVKTSASVGKTWLLKNCTLKTYKGFLHGTPTTEQHFGFAPAAPFAIAVIILEFGASMLILSGLYRWVGALALGGFTLFATLLANRFWDVPPDQRFATENSFFEHLGLVGGFVLVARKHWLSRIESWKCIGGLK